MRPRIAAERKAKRKNAARPAMHFFVSATCSLGLGPARDTRQPEKKHPLFIPHLCIKTHATSR
jgi:hypothetical protein